MLVHAMDDILLPMLKEPELNYTDFCGVMILFKVFKVSHVCKHLAEPKHPSIVPQAFK